MGQKASAPPGWGPTLPDGGGPRTALITGGNSGLGFECARRMLAQGWSVVLACRNEVKGRAAVARLGNGPTGPGPGCAPVEMMLLDVSSLASINRFATAWGARKLHVLVCNAGIMMGPQRQSVDGFDLQLATNYLGHFHLVNLLRDNLVASAPARVIHVSSIAARFGHIYWDDINHIGGEYNSLTAYQQSKLLQVVYSRELAARLEGTGVTSNSLEPGIVKTGLSEGITDDPNMRRRLENGVSVEEGAKTHVMLAMSSEVGGTTGQHWENERIISQGLQKFKYLIAAHDLRASVGPRLWEFTESLLQPKLSALAGGDEGEVRTKNAAVE